MIHLSPRFRFKCPKSEPNRKSNAIFANRDPRSFYFDTLFKFVSQLILFILGPKFGFSGPNRGRIKNLVQYSKLMTRGTPVTIFCSVLFYLWFYSWWHVWASPREREIFYSKRNWTLSFENPFWSHNDPTLRSKKKVRVQVQCLKQSV